MYMFLYFTPDIAYLWPFTFYSGATVPHLWIDKLWAGSSVMSFSSFCVVFCFIRIYKKRLLVINFCGLMCVKFSLWVLRIYISLYCDL